MQQQLQIPDELRHSLKLARENVDTAQRTFAACTVKALATTICRAVPGAFRFDLYLPETPYFDPAVSMDHIWVRKGRRLIHLDAVLNVDDGFTSEELYEALKELTDQLTPDSLENLPCLRPGDEITTGRLLTVDIKGALALSLPEAPTIDAPVASEPEEPAPEPTSLGAYLMCGRDGCHHPLTYHESDSCGVPHCRCSGPQFAALRAAGSSSAKRSYVDAARIDDDGQPGQPRPQNRRQRRRRRSRR